MAAEQRTVLKIKGLICNLPTNKHELCKLITEQIRQLCVVNGEPGILAVSLVCAEGMALAQSTEPLDQPGWKPSDPVWPPTQGGLKGIDL